MKAKTGPSTKQSESDKVDAFMANLQHPLANVTEALRTIILSSDPEIGEEIKWNAPAFFYTGELSPFDPKQYKRHIAVFNLFKKDCVRLVFPTGAKIDESDGLLEGDYCDGRTLALFCSMDEVFAKKAALQRAIKKWLLLLDRS
jgi:hypothetical protein